MTDAQELTFRLLTDLQAEHSKDSVPALLVTAAKIAATSDVPTMIQAMVNLLETAFHEERHLQTHQNAKILKWRSK